MVHESKTACGVALTVTIITITVKMIYNNVSMSTRLDNYNYYIAVFCVAKQLIKLY